MASSGGAGAPLTFAITFLPAPGTTGFSRTAGGPVPTPSSPRPSLRCGPGVNSKKMATWHICARLGHRSKWGCGKEHENETPRVEAKKLALAKMGA
jgi:hypothetical protein